MTRAEWEILAREALEAGEWAIARKAFSELHSLRELELLQTFEERRRRGGPEADPLAVKADLLAFTASGADRFPEAASLYKRAGLETKALQMFSDLRLFQKAKVLYFHLHSDAFCYSNRNGSFIFKYIHVEFICTLKGVRDSARCARSEGPAHEAGRLGACHKPAARGCSDVHRCW